MASMTDMDAPKPFLTQEERSAFMMRAGQMGGIILFGFALFFYLVLFTYDMRDPTWFQSTPAEPHNLFGLFGAYLADILFRSLGFAAWLIPSVALVWAWRLVRAKSESRFWSRIAFAPFALILCSVFLSGHPVLAGWPFTFGLGGLLGDGLLSPTISNLTVESANVRLMLISFLIAPFAIFLLLISCGVDRSEIVQAIKFCWSSLRTVAFMVASSIARTYLKKQQSYAEDEAETEVKAPRLRTEPVFGDEPKVSAVKPPVIRNLKKPKQSKRAVREKEPMLAFDDQNNSDYDAPPLNLLAEADPGEKRHQVSNEALEENARMLETVLEDYGVKGDIINVRPGPVVTLYELEPAPGLKASRVIGLADDIARSMSALAARVAVVPGRNVIGIELPNSWREKVMLREMFSNAKYDDADYPLALALGKNISGEPVITNLARMPHLLIAGTTGSGKSVAINTMILSLLYRLSPKDCRMIMIDPKMLELSVYDDIPHLLAPVVTDPKKAVVALKWVVREMEDRYRKMSKLGVRNIDGYNERVQDAIDRNEPFSRVVQTGYQEDTGEPIYEEETFAPEKLPLIVVVVDEMADLMMVAGKEIEACIQRLAQMARASGIHLIMATQRPSVDVITGTIKANFPTRISFQVTSKIDSRTILGEQGAEQLLGQGDMLYMSGGGKVSRVHGPFVSDMEVEEVVNHLKSLGRPEYIEAVTESDDANESVNEILGLETGDGDDALYDQAVAIVARDRKASTSYIQRKLQIGYNRAARIVDQMEEQGVISMANHVGKREVLVGNVE